MASTQRLATELAHGSGRSTPGRGPALPGQATAVVQIPALGRSWQYPVYEGTGEDELGKGLAHYIGTAGPGEVGNYALAGHRSSLAGFEPFADLPDLVHPGDEVIVTAPAGVFRYLVTATENATPSAVQVLAADQGRGADPSRRLITLTTCTPRFGHSGRFIVFGQLARPGE
ncbi:sortase [Streptacidiphilus sp. MAP12-20]|uniref:sortase n=1 Tax=Streptacidiphilus sp. MAP12-20 TaxID=3156299 RepID=UPI003516BD6D